MTFTSIFLSNRMSLLRNSEQEEEGNSTTAMSARHACEKMALAQELIIYRRQNADTCEKRVRTQIAISPEKIREFAVSSVCYKHNSAQNALLCSLKLAVSCLASHEHADCWQGHSSFKSTIVRNEVQQCCPDSTRAGRAQNGEQQFLPSHRRYAQSRAPPNR